MGKFPAPATLGFLIEIEIELEEILDLPLEADNLRESRDDVKSRVQKLHTRIQDMRKQEFHRLRQEQHDAKS